MFRKAVFVILFCLTAANFVFAAGIHEYGNNDIVTIDRPVSSLFENIILNTPGRLQIYQSEDIYHDRFKS